MEQPGKTKMVSVMDIPIRDLDGEDIDAAIEKHPEANCRTRPFPSGPKIITVTTPK